MSVNNLNMIHDTYANDSTALKIIYRGKTSFIKRADSFESAHVPTKHRH